MDTNYRRKSVLPNLNFTNTLLKTVKTSILRCIANSSKYLFLGLTLPRHLVDGRFTEREQKTQTHNKSLNYMLEIQLTRHLNIFLYNKLIVVRIFSRVKGWGRVGIMEKCWNKNQFAFYSPKTIAFSDRPFLNAIPIM